LPRGLPAARNRANGAARVPVGHGRPPGARACPPGTRGSTLSLGAAAGQRLRAFSTLLGPWSPCVSAVRPGLADRRPGQTGGHRRVTGGFVPWRDELRLETRRARVKPELQRLRWAGGREHGRGWQEGDRPESDRQRTTCASTATAATSASRRSQRTPTACPCRLPRANTSWTNQ
jgi:hypothetical protein